MSSGVGAIPGIVGAAYIQGSDGTIKGGSFGLSSTTAPSRTSAGIYVVTLAAALAITDFVPVVSALSGANPTVKWSYNATTGAMTITVTTSTSGAALDSDVSVVLFRTKVGS